MYRQFNQSLKAKWKLTLQSCIIVVGRGLAGKRHIAFRNIEGLDMSKSSHVYNNETTKKSDQGKTYQCHPCFPQNLLEPMLTND